MRRHIKMNHPSKLNVANVTHLATGKEVNVILSTSTIFNKLNLEINTEDIEVHLPTPNKFEILEYNREHDDTESVKRNLLESLSRLKYQCHVCEFSTEDLKKFGQHIGNHPRNEILKCVFCNFLTWLPYEYQRHVQQHTVDKRFKCTHCGKRFLYKNDGKKHHANKHPELEFDVVDLIENVTLQDIERGFLPVAKHANFQVNVSLSDICLIPKPSLTKLLENNQVFWSSESKSKESEGEVTGSWVVLDSVGSSSESELGSSVKVLKESSQQNQKEAEPVPDDSTTIEEFNSDKNISERVECRTNENESHEAVQKCETPDRNNSSQDSSFNECNEISDADVKATDTDSQLLPSEQQDVANSTVLISDGEVSSQSEGEIRDSQPKTEDGPLAPTEGELSDNFSQNKIDQVYRSESESNYTRNDRKEDKQNGHKTIYRPLYYDDDDSDKNRGQSRNHDYRRNRRPDYRDRSRSRHQSYSSNRSAWRPSQEWRQNRNSDYYNKPYYRSNRF